MVAQVVVGVGHRHTEYDPFPQLSQILPGSRPIGADERRQIQITAPVRRRGSIGFSQ